VKGLIGRKLGMTRIYRDGKAFGVTVIKAGPCTVVQKKSAEEGEYDALQLGFEELTKERARKVLSKPVYQRFEHSKVKPHRVLREVRVNNVADYKVGDVIDVSIFADGDIVDVTSISKGKGFSGVMKRWNFRGGEATRGSKFHREMGSMGAGTDPAKIFKGKKMPGRYGGVRMTVQNLKVIRVDAENGLIAIDGPVPGARGSLVVVKSSRRP
jgi:large subunit ribosomal protein L3